mmetsp:Transcript_13760/g.27888  ORF Transcript_13760/g.27888 Transcript_13760/m.27888 type:complete len:295 (-) Transcript_13760:205-1089(-)
MCSTTMHTKEKVVAPEVGSGFQRRKGTIAFGLLLQTVVYICMYFPQKMGIFNFRPDEKYCEEHSDADGECTRADLFAFQFAAGLMLFYLGLVGFIAWHITKTAHNNIPKTPEGRIFGYLKEGENLNVAIFCFQAWDFVVSSMIPEHCSLVFLSHHFLAALTAFLSLEYQYVHHYAVFFGGLSEFSSIFLVFCDLEVFFPAHMQDDSFYGTFIFACQAIFTLTFFIYRVIGWWYVSIRLWKDAYYVFNNGLAERLRPGKSYVLYMFLAADIILGTLQVFWFGQILQKVAEVLSGN